MSPILVVEIVERKQFYESSHRTRHVLVFILFIFIFDLLLVLKVVISLPFLRLLVRFVSDATTLTGPGPDAKIGARSNL